MVLQQADIPSHMRSYSRNYTLYLGALASVIIVPKIRLTSDYTFGFDDFISIGLFISALIFSINEKDRPFRNVSRYFYIILLMGFFSHIYGNYVHMSTFAIPGEMIQYIKRFVFFVLAYKFTIRVQSYNGIDKIIKILIVVYSLSLLVGFLQLIGIKEFAELYSRSEKQVRVALRTGNDFKMIGTSGMTTSWGVLCAYFYIFFTSLVLVYKQQKKLIYVGLILISILFSLNTVSRSAYVSVVFISAYFLKIYLFDQGYLNIDQRRSDQVMKIFKFVMVVPIFLVLVLTMVGNAKLGDITQRFEKSTPGVGSQHYEDNARFAEMKSAYEALNIHPSGYIIGLGRLLSTKYTEHIEVEPFYLLSVYGAIGLIFRILILYHIYRISRIVFKKASTRELKLFSIIVRVATPMYFIASMGLAFWHEQVSGTPFWLIVGILFALRNIESSSDRTVQSKERLLTGQLIK